jgi:hypothetical protein
MAALKGLATSPWTTAALTAIPAVAALNDSQGGPGENLVSAAGAATGGLTLGGLGLLAGRRAGNKYFGGRPNLGAAVLGGGGALLGGLGGGSLARTGAELINGSSNDPARQAIRDAERMARSQMALEAERAQTLLPAQRAQMQLAAEEETRRAALMAQMGGIASYQNALFGAARGGAIPGDPGWGAVLSSIAAGGLG